MRRFLICLFAILVGALLPAAAKTENLKRKLAPWCWIDDHPKIFRNPYLPPGLVSIGFDRLCFGPKGYLMSHSLSNDGEPSWSTSKWKLKDRTLFLEIGSFRDETPGMYFKHICKIEELTDTHLTLAGDKCSNKGRYKREAYSFPAFDKL